MNTNVRQRIIVGTIVVVIIAGLVWLVWKNGTNKSGIAFADQGRNHIAIGAAHPEYNSNPPTSGWHYEEWERDWGIQTEPVPYEMQVHNLEHGGIIVHYNPNTITNPEELNTLFTELQKKNKKMLLVSNETIETTYALTAWTKLDTFDVYDAERIRAFVKAYYDKGPEKTRE